MTTKNADSLAEFSLCPLFRRKWHSTYEAIEDCRPNSNKLMKRYIQEIPNLEYVLLGIDNTHWEFKAGKTLKDRGYNYKSSAQNSSILGLGYSTIAWLPQLENKGSWTLPLRHERITSFETALSKATWQLWLSKDLVEQSHLPWQKSQQNLTPPRIAQSMFSLLIEIGSPTTIAKTRKKAA